MKIRGFKKLKEDIKNKVLKKEDAISTLDRLLNENFDENSNTDSELSIYKKEVDSIKKMTEKNINSCVNIKRLKQENEEILNSFI